ncbi:MAG: hypothetical protein JSU80_10295, partial [Deltaproteobacteria bacterium]
MKIRVRNKRSIAVMLAFMVTWICLCGLVSKAWALPTLGDVYSNVYTYAGTMDLIPGVPPPPGQYQSNAAPSGAVDATWHVDTCIMYIGDMCVMGGGSSQADAHAELFPDVSATSINAAGLASVTTSASGSSPFPGTPLPSLTWLSASAQSTLSV